MSVKNTKWFYIAITACVLICTSLVILSTQNLKDFSQDYLALKAYQNGSSMYTDTSQGLAAENGIAYPVSNCHQPSSVLLTAPFCFFNYATSYYLISFISFCLHFYIIYLLAKRFKFSKNETYTALAILGFWTPFLYLLYQGNTNIFVSFGVILSWLLLSRHKEVFSGLLLGIAASFKLYALYFGVFLIAKRSLMACVSFISSFLLVVALSVLVFGVGDTQLYISQVASNCFERFGDSLANISLSGIILPFFQENGQIKPIINSANTGILLVYIFSFLLIIINLCSLRIAERRNTQECWDLNAVSIMLAMILLSPLSWQHSLHLALPAIFLLYKKFRTTHSQVKLKFLGLATLATFISDYRNPILKLKENPDILIGYGEFIFNTKMQALAVLVLLVLLIIEIFQLRRVSN